MPRISPADSKSATTYQRDKNVFNSERYAVNDSKSKEPIENIDLSNETASEDWIFGVDAADNKQYGGDQGSLIFNIDQFINDPQAIEIINRYYPNTTAEDRELLFFRMNTCGCGYIATINTIMQYFCTKDEQDFINTFGFSPYEYEPRVSPESGLYSGMYKRFNYEYLYLDYFLYVAKNQNHYKTIEDVYGNAEEERQIRSQDAALNSSRKNFEQTGMTGTFSHQGATWALDYLKEKDINLRYFSVTEYMLSIRYSSANELTKKINILQSSSDPSHEYINNPEFFYNSNFINKSLEEGKMVVVDATDFPMYYSYDYDGNGKLDDIYNPDVGGHAMMVTGIDKETGKLIVSSWGRKYLIDASSIEDITIYDYSKQESLLEQGRKTINDATNNVTEFIDNAKSNIDDFIDNTKSNVSEFIDDTTSRVKETFESITNNNNSKK